MYFQSWLLKGEMEKQQTEAGQMGTGLRRLLIVPTCPGSVGCGAMHGDFKGDSAVVYEH